MLEKKWVSENVNLITMHFGSHHATDVWFNLSTGHLPIQICSNCFDGELNDASVPMITRCFADR